MSNKETKTINPNQPADFQPERQPYTPLRPFRHWCQKVLPLVYDDSLSYYELLCKVVDYLNKTMEDVDNFNTDMTSLYDTYEQLQEYVNNYFSSLDVQTEINNKLDSMASDGTLLNIISETVINEVDSHIDKMASDGSLLEVIDDTVVSTTENSFNTIKNNGQLLNIMKPTIQEEASSTADEWLSSNLTDPANPPLDSSLTLENAAANAKATGDRLAKKLGYVPQEGSASGNYTGSYNRLSDLPNFSMVLVWENAMRHYSDTQSLGEEYLSKPYHYIMTLCGTNTDTIGNNYVVFLLSMDNAGDIQILSNQGADNAWFVKTTLIPTDSISDNDVRLAKSGAVYEYVENRISDSLNRKLGFVPEEGSASGDYTGSRAKLGDLPFFSMVLVWKNAMNHYSDTQSLGEKYLSRSYHYLMTLSSGYHETLGSSGYVTYLLSISNEDEFEIIRSTNVGGVKSWIIVNNLTPTNVISDNNTNLARSGAVYEYVEKVKTDINNEISSIKEQINNYNPPSTTIIGCNMHKYAINVCNNELIAIDKTPTNCLFVGNSLLLGNKEFGMCASDSNHDYVAILKNKYGFTDYERLSGTTFEGATSENIATQWMNNTLLPHLTNDLNFVMIQLGDNVNTPEKQSLFKNTTCLKLCQFVKQHAPKAIIYWAGLWYQEQLKETIKSCCEQTGLTFIDFTGLSGSTENQSAIGNVITYETVQTKSYDVDSFDILEDNNVTLHFTVNEEQYTSTLHYQSYTSDAGIQITVTGYQQAVTQSGVASHPGDTGFAKIAEKMIEAIEG